MNIKKLFGFESKNTKTTTSAFEDKFKSISKTLQIAILALGISVGVSAKTTNNNSKNQVKNNVGISASQKTAWNNFNVMSLFSETVSVVDLLKQIEKVDPSLGNLSSKESRAKIYNQVFGMTGEYRGTATQNKDLLALIKAGIFFDRKALNFALKDFSNISNFKDIKSDNIVNDEMAKKLGMTEKELNEKSKLIEEQSQIIKELSNTITEKDNIISEKDEIINSIISVNPIVSEVLNEENTNINKILDTKSEITSENKILSEEVENKANSLVTSISIEEKPILIDISEKEEISNITETKLEPKSENLNLSEEKVIAKDLEIKSETPNIAITKDEVVSNGVTGNILGVVIENKVGENTQKVTVNAISEKIDLNTTTKIGDSNLKLNIDNDKNADIILTDSENYKITVEGKINNVGDYQTKATFGVLYNEAKIGSYLEIEKGSDLEKIALSQGFALENGRIKLSLSFLNTVLDTYFSEVGKNISADLSQTSIGIEYVKVNKNSKLLKEINVSVISHISKNTDLGIIGEKSYSNEQTSVYGGVIGGSINYVSLGTVSELSQKLRLDTNINFSQVVNNAMFNSPETIEYKAGASIDLTARLSDKDVFSASYNVGGINDKVSVQYDRYFDNGVNGFVKVENSEKDKTVATLGVKYIVGGEKNKKAPALFNNTTNTNLDLQNLVVNNEVGTSNNKFTTKTTKEVHKNFNPESISLSINTVGEFVANGYEVATISVDDNDTDDIQTLSIISQKGVNNNVDINNVSPFKIVGNKLVVNDNSLFNYDLCQSFKITINTVDKNGKSLPEDFIITINGNKTQLANISYSNNGQLVADEVTVNITLSKAIDTAPVGWTTTDLIHFSKKYYANTSENVTFVSKGAENIVIPVNVVNLDNKAPDAPTLSENGSYIVASGITTKTITVFGEVGSEIFIDGVSKGTIGTDGYSNINIGVKSELINDYNVYLEDSVGHISEIAGFTITVQETPPDAPTSSIIQNPVSEAGYTNSLTLDFDNTSVDANLYYMAVDITNNLSYVPDISDPGFTKGHINSIQAGGFDGGHEIGIFVKNSAGISKQILNINVDRKDAELIGEDLSLLNTSGQVASGSMTFDEPVTYIPGTLKFVDRNGLDVGGSITYTGGNGTSNMTFDFVTPLVSGNDVKIVGEVKDRAGNQSTISSSYYEIF